MSYRLSLLDCNCPISKLQQHTKSEYYLKFRFRPLACWISAVRFLFLSFFFLLLTKQTQRTIGIFAIDWSLNGLKQFLYAIHQHSEKRIDIHCKVTFGFKYIIMKMFHYWYGILSDSKYNDTLLAHMSPNAPVKFHTVSVFVSKQCMQIK